MNVALTIAGSDPSGGAGIQADLRTFAAFDVFGTSAITALTAQNTLGVFGVHAVPVDFIAAQARAVFEDLPVAAIKVGMLGTREVIECVAELIEQGPAVPVVLDPVMVAASGDPLLPADAAEALRERLLPLATVVTPNATEAALLSSTEVATSEEQLADQARQLAASSGRAVLVKGGRLALPGEVVDVHAAGSTLTFHRSPRVRIDTPHGSGCTLSSALAANLALGRGIDESIERARAYVRAALERGAAAGLGKGSTPLVGGTA